MVFVLVGKARQVFATLKLAAERRPDAKITRSCPYDEGGSCDVDIKIPCSYCKVWQNARAKAHEEKGN